MMHGKDFQRIQCAIEFISENIHSQPSLADIAAHVHLSHHHFQRLFQQWVGISPKKFSQYLSIERAKALLEEQHSLFETAQQLGLSGTSRLHDLFVTIEGMTPGEYKNGGAELAIAYDYYDTPFGQAIMASTVKGICHIAFEDSPELALKQLTEHFPNAVFTQCNEPLHDHLLTLFDPLAQSLQPISLHLKGTPFQLKVWQSLLKIPSGKLVNYAQIAQDIGQPKAARAVGTAIANNVIAYLIPCHRVIRNSGHFGNYRWGSTRKAAIIGWEAAKTDIEDE